jgi:hypothetical protein
MFSPIELENEAAHITLRETLETGTWKSTYITMQAAMSAASLAVWLYERSGAFSAKTFSASYRGTSYLFKAFLIITCKPPHFLCWIEFLLLNEISNEFENAMGMGRRGGKL